MKKTSSRIVIAIVSVCFISTFFIPITSGSDQAPADPPFQSITDPTDIARPTENLTLVQFQSEQKISAEQFYPTDSYEPANATVFDGPVITELEKAIDEITEEPLTGFNAEEYPDVVVPPPEPNAPGDDNTWSAAADSSWSVDASWSLGHKPSAGEDVIFDATSVKNCAINEDTATLGSFSVNSGYTGVITNSASCDVTTSGDITISAGTVTSVTTAIWTCGGNFVDVGNKITFFLMNLVMTGSGKSITTTTADFYPYTIRFSGNTTLATKNVNTYGATVDAGVTVTTASVAHLQIYLGVVVGDYSNSGTIGGASGGLDIYYSLASSDSSIAFGTVNCPILVTSTGLIGASRVLSLNATATLGSTLTVNSGHATRTVTLSHGSNYALTVTGLTTLGARGIMSQGTGAWSFNGGLTINGASASFTQGGNVSVTGTTTVALGTLTPNASYTWSQGGSFTHSGGEIPNLSINLIWTATGTLTQSVEMTGMGDCWVARSWVIKTGVTLSVLDNGEVTRYGSRAVQLTIEAGAILNVQKSATTIYPLILYPGYDNGDITFSYSNLGTIQATNFGANDYIFFWAESTGVSLDASFGFGNITCNVYLHSVNDDADNTWTMNGPSNLTQKLFMDWSGGVKHHLTLDTNNQSFIVGGLFGISDYTVFRARGPSNYLNGGLYVYNVGWEHTEIDMVDAIIYCGVDWDSVYLMTLTAADSTLVMSGTGKNLSMKSGHNLYDLTVTGSINLLGYVGASGHLNVSGTVVGGPYSLTVTAIYIESTGNMTQGPGVWLFSSIFMENGAYFYTQLTILIQVEGWGAVAIQPSGYVIFEPLGCDLSASHPGDITYHFNSSAIPGATVRYIIYGLNASMGYYVYQDGSKIYDMGWGQSSFYFDVDSFSEFNITVYWPLYFTTSPITTCEPDSKYNYTIGYYFYPGGGLEDSDIIVTLETNAPFLVLFNRSILGIVVPSDQGLYYVNVTIDDGYTSVTQRYILEVVYVGSPSMTMETVILLVVAISLTAFGFIDKKFFIFGGLVWIFGAVSVMYPYGAGWSVISLGLGMAIMAEGVIGIENEG